MGIKNNCRILTFTALSLFVTSICGATPKNLEAYTEQRGGFVQLPFGSYVEGSARHGGIQPDYEITDTDPALTEFLKKLVDLVGESREIKNAEFRGNHAESRNLKIALTTETIRSALPLGQYDSAPYRKVLSEHRLQQKDIQLGAYLQCQAGVCRENALLTHQALRALGVESHFVYIKAHSGKRVEDHALVVVNENGKTWIVDPYNAAFHGRDFNEAMRQEAWSRVTPSVAPFANRSNYVARILKVLKYPSYWIPNSALCKNVFL